jgi:hydroxysqualene synthase
MKKPQEQIEKYLSGKTEKDENFPVSSFLIAKRFKKHIKSLYIFARNADDIADNTSLEPSKKRIFLLKFDEIIKSKTKTDYVFLNNLIDTLNETQISTQYPRNLLKAFLQDANKKRYNSWDQLIHYCNNSASPVGRFVVNLHMEQEKNSSALMKKIYLGCDDLCNSLQILNHIQDCKKDFLKLDRVYIPGIYFKEENLNISEMLEEKNRDKILRILSKCLFKVENLLDDSRQNIKLIKDNGLRKETFVIFNIAKKLTELLKKEDPIKKKVKLSRIDLIFCFFKGIIGRL